MSVKIPRRVFLQATGAAPLFPWSSLRAAKKESSAPVTGKERAELAPFDELMTSFIAEHKVPGAALAVSRQQRLLYARGFGYANVEQKTPVDPDMLFRIASVSKPLTAVAIMQLVEQGKIGLDDRVLERMPLAADDRIADPRWKLITIRHCLQHTGGWDRGKSFDPIGRASTIAKTLDVPLPVGPREVIRYMYDKPLDFDPGERFAYSNLGYLILGRIIELTSEIKYEKYVKEHVLAPLGIKQMQLGRALLKNRLPNEVHYYDVKNRKKHSVYPPLEAEVPVQYGGENFEGYEAHGGWVASAPDLIRFASAFDIPDKCPILSKPMIDDMWKRPEGATGKNDDGTLREKYYGCGWNVMPFDNRAVTTWHSGLITGTSSLLVRRHDGLNWAVLFNTDRSPDEKILSSQIDGLLHKAANQVKSWPEG